MRGYLTTGVRLGVTAAAFFAAGWILSPPALAAETPPDLYRSAPVIPYAKKAGEHRFRSPRTYEDTLTYYRKVFAGDENISFEKIINTPAVRGMHMRNKAPGRRWDGLNIYENRGQTFIFVVFTDAELAAIAAEAEKKSPKPAAPKKPGDS